MSSRPEGIQRIRSTSPRHASTYEDHQLRAPQAVWDAGVPVLGICYGMQTMAVQLGGEVSWSDHREFGYAEVRAHGHTKLLQEELCATIDPTTGKSWYDLASQAFTVFLPVKSAGVMGNGDGQRPHLRLRHGAARGPDQRLHDGGLGGAALQPATRCYGGFEAN